MLWGTVSAALTGTSDFHGLGQLGFVGPDILGPGFDGALVTYPDVLSHL